MSDNSSRKVEEDDPLLDAGEVAKMLGDYNVETVRRWMRKGIIGVTRVGPFGRPRVRRSEVLRHMKETPGAKT